MDFSEKIVLITGASRGIGLAAARRFQELGATVLTAQRNPCGIDGIEHLATDLADPGACEALLGTIADRHGGLDVLINNAGFMMEARVDETSIEDWDRTLSLNLRTPFLLIKHAAPLMRARGGGAIVNTGSIEGLGSNPNHAAYGASKAGLHGLTRAAAVDLGPDNIRCNAVAPGWIDTDLNEAFIESMPDPAAFRENIGRIHPMGKTGSPEEVAALIVWLASNDASFITGQVYTIDGGRMSKLSLP